MKFHQVGLALLLNAIMIAGSLLPGITETTQPAVIQPAVVNAEKKEEPRVPIAEVVLEGVPENLKSVVLNAIVTKAGATTTRSQLQRDIDAIFQTGWFKEAKVTPSDTPKGVRVTFSVVLNPILRRVDVKPKTQLAIPQSIVDEIFAPHYGKALNPMTLQDGMKKLLRWLRQRDEAYNFSQVDMPKDISSDGIVTLGFSNMEVNAAANVLISRSDYIAFGKVAEENGDLDDAIKSYQKAAVLIPESELNQGQAEKSSDHPIQMGLQPDPFDDSPQRDKATAYKLISNVLKKKKQFPEADVAYRQALSIEADLGQAHLNFKKGEQLFQKGDAKSLRQAIGHLQQTLQLSRKNHIKSLQGLVLDRLGRVYDALGEKQKALGFYDQAMPIARSIVGDPDEITMLTFEEKEKALAIATKALQHWQFEGIRFAEAQALQEIGTIYYALSEYQKALDFYNQALQIHRATDVKFRVAYTLHRIGDIYSKLGETQKALDFYNQALPLYRIIGSNAKSYEGEILDAIATVSLVLGDRESSFKFYDQALVIHRETGKRLAEANTLNRMGAAYARFGDPSKALVLLNQSLTITRTIANRLGEADTLRNIGAIYSESGDPQKALDYFNQALPIYKAKTDRAGEANVLSNLAAVYVTQNKLTDALQNINAAIAIIESLRSELKNDALKTSYFASVQDIYQLKTNILMQLHQQQPTKGYDAAALENSDRSRARILRELLIQANAKINKDISPDLRQQEQALSQSLEAKEKQLVQFSTEPGKETQVTSLNQEIAALYAQRDDLKNTIRASNPAYANLQYPQPITLAQIQQQLEPGTLMLQYSLGEKESYLWVISNNALKTYILPNRRDIEKAASIFRQQLGRQPAPTNNPSQNPQLIARANKLTQQILTPAAADLANKRLIIIPDGVLHTIPFTALNTPNSTIYNPILTQHEITNLPSASTIGILRSTVATKPRGSKTLAILADPIFRKNDPRLAGQTIQASKNLDLGEQMARGRLGRDLNFDRLPFTAVEAKGILALVPNQDSTSAFGFDASYDWITDPKISQYRYVHLATHGFFDDEKPALSSIVLSSFDAQGRDRKAFLRFPDLFNLNLPTELVVLSACETGLGNNVPGEGLVGMTRGLMYAGALRVGVSLWQVDDQATSELMQQFYQALWTDKQSHAAALRKAQLNLWKQGKDPYYWAAFTLQGEWRN